MYSRKSVICFKRIPYQLLFCILMYWFSSVQFGFGLGEMNSSELFVPVYVSSDYEYSDTFNSMNKSCKLMDRWFKDCIPLPSKYHYTFIDPWIWCVSIFPIGGFIASFFSGSASDFLSRKYTIWLISFVYIISYVLKSLFSNFWALLVGRFIMGVASGVASSVVPLYLNEIAPTKIRGGLGVMSQFGIGTGVTLSQIIGQYWRLLFGSIGIIAILQLIFIPFTPFSPRWLLKREKVKCARRELEKLRQTKEVDDEIQCMSAGLIDRSETEFVMPRKKIILHFVIGIGLQLIQQFSGVTAIAFYSTKIFIDAKLTNIMRPDVITAIVSGVRLLAIGSSIFVIDRIGRKPLLVWGMFFQFLSLTVLTIALSINKYWINETWNIVFGLISIISVITYGIFFGFGIGPIPWFVGGEIFTTDLRPIAQSICCAINWIGMFTIGLVFPIMQKYLQQFTFIPFMVVLLFGSIFIQVLFTETKNKTIEEICYGKNEITTLQ